MSRHSQHSEKGFTLTELLIAISIMTLLTVAAAGLVYSYLEAQEESERASTLHQEALLTMERMTLVVKGCTFLHIPNSHSNNRQLLAVSGMGNDDNDFYFGDPLFPRIDEDVNLDMTKESSPGIPGWDDDGDGHIDEDSGLPDSLYTQDDDEDGLANEDPLDGWDNDGDGNVDEDTGEDMTDDGHPGIEGIDDDCDGPIDEGLYLSDDDEDDTTNEDWLNPRLFHYDGGLNIIREGSFDEGTWTWTWSLLCSHVTGFDVTYYPPSATRAPLVSISMTLTGDDGETLSLMEYVYPRNILQKTGKRVH